MRELSSYERRRFAEIEQRLNDEPGLAREVKRFERGGVWLHRGSFAFWLCLVIGILGPASTVVTVVTSTPLIGLWVACATTATFVTAMLCTAHRS